MKRNERRTYNMLKKAVTPDTIYVEIPVNYSHEARQAIHELLTVGKNMVAECIGYMLIPDAESGSKYGIRYIPCKGISERNEKRMNQESSDVGDVMNSLQKTVYAWNGTKDPDADKGPENGPEPAAKPAAKKTRKRVRKGYDIGRMYAILADAMEADNAVFHEPRGNSKLGGIPAWNILPGCTCSATACGHCLREGCYALKNVLCHGYSMEKNACLKAWTENTVLIKRHVPLFAAAMDAWLTKHRPESFRIHSSGDFDSIEYAAAWFIIIKNHPETRFLAFTKQWDVVRSVPFYTLPNIEIVLSGWTGISIPEDLRAHYRVAWCNDGTESRIPADAIHCPGSCEHCRACWNLSAMGKDSYFDKH